MKELSIKEKAQAYDKAIKEAYTAYKDEDRHLKATLERIFPELKNNRPLEKEHTAWLETQAKQEQLYIRFGEIPTDEKSRIYRGEIEVGIENGVSVYPAFKTNEGDIVLGLNLPITKTTLHTQQHLIEYDNRPCYLVKGDYIGKDTDGQLIVSDDNVNEMNEAIISSWNKVVPPNALVWHLGDFALGDRSKIPEIVARLNGRINLVLGNHDHKDVKRFLNAGFNRVYDHPVLINKFVILTHEPLEFLNVNCPFFQIFGHVHDSEHYQTWSKTGACVCVERHDYAPVPWTKIYDKYNEFNVKD